MNITAKELRERYLQFFREKGHQIIPGASLIPEHDPTVLFTTAGMHPLTPFLLGEKHPAGQKLADVQKCVRTGDIDSVGDSWHLTFFEMLGNWSLGDYWKKEAIEWSFEFLTEKKWLGIPAGKLSITVFAGDKDAPEDKESAKIWQKLGILKERIYYLPKEENWWGPAGQTGPCGPCTEVFYDTGKEKCNSNCRPGCSCGKYAEIWNDVFMEFNKIAAGKFEKMPMQNVDTGMGLERTISVLNGKKDAFDNELFLPLIQKIEELSGKKYGESPEITRAMRIIADHIKAATFILGDEKGLTPSNVGAGYVLRRLIRRAVRNGFSLGIKEIFTSKIAEEVTKIYQDTYTELKKNKEFIINQLVQEEEKFKKTLERGLGVLDKELKAQIIRPGQPYKVQPVSLIQGPGDIQMWDIRPSIITGKWLFDFYQTLGFPPQMIIEELKLRGYYFTLKEYEELINDFEEEMQKHQELSRTASAGMFKGGLADASEQTIKYHTAAHLMLAALRKVFGENVLQKGSNITSERLRFDFSYSEKVTPEQIKQIEDLVNEKIKQDLPVVCEELSLEEAKEKGAMGVFDSKYGDRVKVYTIDDFSREICGGPHVNRTSELGKFKIIKEESASAGVRRIKAILE